MPNSTEFRSLHKRSQLEISILPVLADRKKIMHIQLKAVTLFYSVFLTVSQIRNYSLDQACSRGLFTVDTIIKNISR